MFTPHKTHDAQAGWYIENYKAPIQIPNNNERPFDIGTMPIIGSWPRILNPQQCIDAE